MLVGGRGSACAARVSDERRGELEPAMSRASARFRFRFVLRAPASAVLCYAALQCAVGSGCSQHGVPAEETCLVLVSGSGSCCCAAARSWKRARPWANRLQRTGTARTRLYGQYGQVKSDPGSNNADAVVQSALSSARRWEWEGDAVECLVSSNVGARNISAPVELLSPPCLARPLAWRYWPEDDPFLTLTPVYPASSSLTTCRLQSSEGGRGSRFMLLQNMRK